MHLSILLDKATSAGVKFYIFSPFRGFCCDWSNFDVLDRSSFDCVGSFGSFRSCFGF